MAPHGAFTLQGPDPVASAFSWGLLPCQYCLPIVPPAQLRSSCLAVPIFPAQALESTCIPLKFLAWAEDVGKV